MIENCNECRWYVEGDCRKNAPVVVPLGKWSTHTDHGNPVVSTTVFPQATPCGEFVIGCERDGCIEVVVQGCETCLDCMYRCADCSMYNTGNMVDADGVRCECPPQEED